MAGNTASLTFRLFGVDVTARQTISNVGVAAAGTAKQLETLSTGTLKFVGIAGAASIASVGLAGAVGVGLAGAFAGAGIAAASLSKDVQKSFKDLGTGIKRELVEVSKPVQDSLIRLSKLIGDSFKTMRPVLQGVFRDIAPLVDVFGKGLVQAVANVVTEFQPFIKEVMPIVRTFFAQVPDLIGNLAAALHMIIDPLASNSKAFGQLIQTIGSLLPIVGSIIGSLVRLGQQIMPVFQRSILAVGTAIDSGLAKVLPLVGKAIQTMLPPLANLISALVRAASQVLPVLLPVLSKVVATLADAAAKVLPQILPSLTQIVAAFARLLPALAPLVAPVLYLAKSVSNLVPPLADLAGKILSALMPALRQLVPAIVAVSGEVGTAFAKAFQQAAPAIVRLAQAVGQILIALTPLIPAIAAAALSFTPLIPAIAKVAAALAEGLVPIVNALVPIIVRFAPAIVKVAIAAKLWTIAQAALNVVLAANPIGVVIIAIAALAAGLVYAYKHSETFRRIVQAAFRGVQAAVSTFWGIAQAVFNWIRGHWPVLAAVLGGPIVAAALVIIRNWDRIRSTAVTAFNAVVSFVKGIPGRILSALGDLGSLLYQAGRNVIQGLINGITSHLPNLAGAISHAAQIIRDHLPFSPAKVGPLSGSGSPFLAGKNISRMIADGMLAGAGGPRLSIGTVLSPLTAPSMRVAGSSLTPRSPMVVNHYHVHIDGVVGSKTEVVAWVRQGQREALRREGKTGLAAQL